MDIDGTLIQTNNQLTPAVADAIRESMHEGVKAILVTARPPFDVYGIYRRLGMTGYIINFNGALILEPGKGIMFHMPVPLDAAHSIVALARKISPNLQLRIDVIDRWYTDRTQKGHRNPNLQAPAKVGPIAEIMRKPPTRLTFLGRVDDISAVRKEMAAQFGHIVTMPFSDDRVLQITHVNTEKVIALQRVASTYDIGQRNIMAIGDAPNDIEMIRWAGCGVAVANAWQEAMDVAKVVVSSNDENGVAEAIRKYVLSP
jgi:Cof subfamily protein (haloacid dehalogenase superfamily)